MQDNHNEDFVESRPVIEMLTVANEYCLFFEQAEKYDVADILEYFRKIAPLLYLKGSTLPEASAGDDAFSERFVTEEQWEAIFKALRSKFGDKDLYYSLDHNYDSQQSSLADNMADIYQDMKDFVMLFQKNILHARPSAVAQIRDLMAHHWGPILINALGATHQIVFTDQINPDIIVDDDNPWIF